MQNDVTIAGSNPGFTPGFTPGKNATSGAQYHQLISAIDKDSAKNRNVWLALNSLNKILHFLNVLK